MPKFVVAVLAIVVLVVLVLLGIFFHFIGVWVRALMSGARVTIAQLIGMSLRKVPPSVIVDARIQVVKAGLQVETDPLEAHYLAGGDVLSVVRALIAADKADIDLTFQRAAAIDLAGRDVLDAVKTSVNPRVIDCPAPGTGAASSGMLASSRSFGSRFRSKLLPNASKRSTAGASRRNS